MTWPLQRLKEWWQSTMAVARVQAHVALKHPGSYADCTLCEAK